MDRKRILIAERDLNEVRDLRKALVTAGYEVRMVDNGTEALAQIETFQPDLLLSEVRLPKLDGPHLLQELRNRPSTQLLPVIMMGSLKTVDERVNTMKLPIDDYQQKPLDLEETLARIEVLLREVGNASTSIQLSVRGFSGTLEEMSLVDLLKTLEVGNKTGVLKLRRDGKEGMVFIQEGQVIDAVLDHLDARQALLRMFSWSDGDFQVEMRHHDRPRMLTTSNHDLISEGLTRQYRWSQLVNQLPPLQAVVRGTDKLGAAMLEDEEKTMVGLLNGSKRLIDLVEESPLDDLRALAVMKTLYDGGYVDAVNLDQEPTNGTYLDKLKQRQTNGHGPRDKIAGLFTSVLQHSNEGREGRQERRRGERRANEDRRRHERRRDDRERPQNRVYLNKSELIVIREKLLHGIRTPS